MVPDPKVSASALIVYSMSSSGFLSSVTVMFTTVEVSSGSSVILLGETVRTSLPAGIIDIQIQSLFD